MHMKEIILICLVVGLFASLTLGFWIDHYRNKRYFGINTPQSGKETDSNITGGLLFIYVLIAMIILGLIS